MRFQFLNESLWTNAYLKIGFVWLILVGLNLAGESIVHALQIQRADAFAPVSNSAQGTDAQDDQDDEKPEPKAKPQEIGDQFAQLHMQDGSIIGGDIKTTSIDVKTAYGNLNIPISRIVQVFPGLNSRPETVNEIAGLVDQLGGPSASDRDVAQKKLVSMGVTIRKIMNQIGKDGNAEQKKRLAQINTEFDEVTEANEEEMLDSGPTVILDDTIVTPNFTIVGEILQKEFQVKSKFGNLTVNLGDIRLADRQLGATRTDIRKSVSVPAMAFFQTTPHSTKIRVNKGDRISISASGTVQWTNWNNTSSPEGLTNRSQWNGINSGKLTARIGTDNSRCIQIGNSEKFVAKHSGILYLGIAMRESYAKSGSYTWTGEYKAKVIVKPRE